MKYTIIILSLIIIILGLYAFFKQSDHIAEAEKMIEVKREKDSIQRLFNAKQAAYNLTALQLHRREAELLISKAAVKRSEDQLAKSKEKERVALKAKKEEVLKMTDIEADSAIRSRFISDPDSIPQKVELALERLSYCDSLTVASDSVLQSYRKQTIQSDSLILQLSASGQISRDQIEILLSSQSKDKEIQALKDKQIHKLRRQNRVLKVLAPVAFVITAILLL